MMTAKWVKEPRRKPRARHLPRSVWLRKMRLKLGAKHRMKACDSVIPNQRRRKESHPEKASDSLLVTMKIAGTIVEKKKAQVAATRIRPRAVQVLGMGPWTARRTGLESNPTSVFRPFVNICLSCLQEEERQARKLIQAHRSQQGRKLRDQRSRRLPMQQSPTLPLLECGRRSEIYCLQILERAQGQDPRSGRLWPV
jgi:hypothetical protein